MKRLLLVLAAVTLVACADAVAPVGLQQGDNVAMARGGKPRDTTIITPIPIDTIIILPCNLDSVQVDGEWAYFCRNPQ